MNVLLNKHHGKRFDKQALHRQLSCTNDSSVRRNVTYRQNASKFQHSYSENDNFDVYYNINLKMQVLSKNM